MGTSLAKICILGKIAHQNMYIGRNAHKNADKSSWGLFLKISSFCGELNLMRNQNGMIPPPPNLGTCGRKEGEEWTQKPQAETREVHTQMHSPLQNSRLFPDACLMLAWNLLISVMERPALNFPCTISSLFLLTPDCAARINLSFLINLFFPSQYFPSH